MIKQLRAIGKITNFGNLDRVEDLHLNYFHLSGLFVLVNMLTSYLFNFRSQLFVFGALFVAKCSFTPLNIIHAAAVIVHDYIHQHWAYFTILETKTYSPDEYWHLAYITFLWLRIDKAKKVYPLLFASYFISNFLFHFNNQSSLIIWAVYISGFTLAYQSIFFESGAKADAKYWRYFVMHTISSLVITGDNPIGRLICTGVPGGSAFLAECIVYSILFDQRAAKKITATKIESKLEMTLIDLKKAE